MKTHIKKTFLDIQKEEEWLNEQGSRGLMLTAYHSGEYVFEDMSPAEYIYKIDLPAYTGAKKRNDMAFLEEMGISVAASYGGRLYLRKNRADGPLELYSEKSHLSKQLHRANAHFFALGISQCMLALFALAQALFFAPSRGLPLWITVAIAGGLMISGSAFFLQGLRRRRKYAPEQEEARIWE